MKTIVEPHSRSPGGSGRFFPGAILPTPNGDSFSIEAFRPQWDLVIALLGDVSEIVDSGPNTTRLLDLLTTGQARIEAEGAKVIAIAAGDATKLAAEWRWPVPLLVDAAGELHASVGAVDEAGRPEPRLVVTDRYREIFASLNPERHDFPETVEDVLEWISFINIQCPECGAPE